MSDFTLYLGSKHNSSWSLRVWLAIQQTGAAFTEVIIPLYQPDTKANILRYSPSGKVPALRHNDLMMWDSLAICEYLAETFPQANLWPAEKNARALARAVSAEMHAGFTSLRPPFPFTLTAAHQNGAIPADTAADIERLTQIWLNCREIYSAAGNFLFGNFSIADIMFAPEIIRLSNYGIKFNGVAADYANAILTFPRITEYLKNVV